MSEKKACCLKASMRKETKANDFTKSVKEAIAKRDSLEDWPCCIFCGLPAPAENPIAFSNAHYIGRAQGGRGVEENGLTLCLLCHRRYDQSEHRERLREFFRSYLKSKYPDWDEEKLYYRR